MELGGFVSPVDRIESFSWVGYLPMLYERDRERLTEAKLLNSEPIFDETVGRYCDVYKLESGKDVQFFPEEYEELRKDKI